MKLEIKKIPELLGKKYIPILLIVMSLILFVVMRSSVAQKQKVYKVGQLAEETVRANKTIENKNETEEKQKIAMESVIPEYSYDASKAKTQVELVSSLFEMVEKVNTEADKIYNDKLNAAKDKKSVSVLSPEERLPMLKSQFEKLNQNSLAYFQS
jgi:membrane-associated HD superfamily phosphohydrolase